METSCCVHLLSRSAFEMPSVSDSGDKKGCQSAWQAASRGEDWVHGATEKVQSPALKHLANKGARTQTVKNTLPLQWVADQSCQSDPCASFTTYWQSLPTGPVEATHTRRMKQCSA
jgi:hypothetical protein